jgi:hypothetical protein
MLIKPNEFRLHKTEKSLNYAGDDIWPRAVRVEFALREMTTQLQADLGASANDFSVYDPTFATGRGVLANVPMKVGAEWITIAARDPRDPDTFLIGTRGRRGTAVVNHPAESNVYFGQVFDMMISIPAFRDDNS